MLELDLEGSWGPSGGELGKRMLFDNIKHSPSTEFYCKWSCGGSLEGLMLLMGQGLEMKAGDGGKRRKDQNQPCGGKRNRGMDLICIRFLSLPNK